MNYGQIPSGLWIRAMLIAGGVLAVSLMMQTIWNYQYVSTSLLRQEARREATERVRGIERAVRLSRPPDLAAFQTLLEDLRMETSDQVASIALLRQDGGVVATAGPRSPAADPEGSRAPPDPNLPLRHEWHQGRELFVGVFVCRCGAPPGVRVEAAGRLLLEVALYRDSLSAPFARLRRNAVISAAAALALLFAVTVIALRIGR